MRELEQFVQNVLKQRREAAQQKVEENLELALANEQFKKAYDQKRSLVFEIAKLKHLNQNPSELVNKLIQIEQSMKQQLLQLGLKEESLEAKYVCSKCNDTGKVNGKPCVCYNNLMSKLLLKNSGLNAEQLPSFATVKTECFEPSLQNEMKTLYEKMKQYIVTMPNTNKKVVTLLGNTGVGKTHLAQCMVNEAIQYGVYGVFTSAYEFGNDMLSYHLAPIANKQSILSKYVNSELLVIDDLGTEPTYKNVTEEYYYLVLSERMNKGFSTIITTNLSLEQMREIYGERIFSRLAFKDKALLIELKGKDLRTKI